MHKGTVTCAIIVLSVCFSVKSEDTSPERQWAELDAQSREKLRDGHTSESAALAFKAASVSLKCEPLNLRGVRSRIIAAIAYVKANQWKDAKESFQSAERQLRQAGALLTPEMAQTYAGLAKCAEHEGDTRTAEVLRRLERETRTAIRDDAQAALDDLDGK